MNVLIISAWKQASWKEPLLENRIDLDEVRLTLYAPFEVSDKNGTQDSTQDIRVKILEQIKDNSKITTEESSKKFNRGVRTIKRLISSMNNVKLIGSGYSGHWEIME